MWDTRGVQPVGGAVSVNMDASPSHDSTYHRWGWGHWSVPHGWYRLRFPREKRRSGYDRHSQETSPEGAGPSCVRRIQWCAVVRTHAQYDRDPERTGCGGDGDHGGELEEKRDVNRERSLELGTPEEGNEVHGREGDGPDHDDSAERAGFYG